MPDYRDFSGKVILITGSSSGIGAVAAEEFSKAGGQVVINGRDAQKLSEVGKQCLKVSPKGLKPLEVVADVSNEEDCKRLIDTTIKAFGKLNVLVNNAGRDDTSSVEDPKILKTFDELMNLNLRSVVVLTHLSVKHLEKTKGNIINISSYLGLRPMSEMGVYCTSKAALDMFTKCCALELGRKGIRVNVVNPAEVYTNFDIALGLDPKTSEAQNKERAKLYPLGRLGEPIDIVNAILFLAADQCSWVTGINFLSAGGLATGTLLNIQQILD